MPTRHDQLDRILASIDRQIAEAEAEMLTSLTDERLRHLIEKQVELRMLRNEVLEKVKDPNNPPTAR
jgi:hypothetical protein